MGNRLLNLLYTYFLDPFLAWHRSVALGMSCAWSFKQSSKFSRHHVESLNDNV